MFQVKNALEALGCKIISAECGWRNDKAVYIICFTDIVGQKSVQYSIGNGVWRGGAEIAIGLKEMLFLKKFSF